MFKQKRWIKQHVPYDGQKQFGVYSSCKSCNILNNFINRSRHFSRHRLVSTDAIASQLVGNGF